MIVEPPRWRLAARTTDGTVRLEVLGPARTAASIQESSNLRNWTEYTPVTTDAAGSAIVTIPVGETSGFRFFRILVP